MSAEEQKMHQQLWANLHGDVLEEVAMHVPIVDLLSASLVSREWRRAVCSSLVYRPHQRPWLILRDLRSPKSSAFSIHALDPYSRSWVSVTRRSISDRPFEMVGPCFMRRSTGDRFCALMFRKMTISKDPFGARWEQDTKAPRKFRLDPVVAEVGWWILVVGGECSIDRDYEEEGPVEVYDKRTGVWESAGLMPVVFEGSTCAAWLSVVASSKRLYVMERKSGWLSWFDPESKRWGPVRQMRPDPGVSAWAITVGYGEKLLLFGARRGRDGDGVMKVKIWEVEGDNLRVVDTEGEEMPAEMVDGLFPADEGQDATWQGYSVHVDMCGTEHGGYVCNPNPLWMRKRNGVVLFDLSRSRSSRIVERWEWVPLPERVGDNPMGRILCGCSPVDFKHILSGLRRY
ncbi:Kelch repeat-containing F-box-like protein [Rhynchospora pubera]|uniref:Kelch repeat-containing F-box-like protein n=1 Tax=Rhynchospora pubera TaxID=906938 RepID=A0AAV8HZF2_9POAL|nr:Kelch repeat-containing F-box-like protein [Rhynchospora pubera]